MARDGLVINWEHKCAARDRAHRAGKKPRFPTRVYNRCKLCHRRGGYIRFFGICRICFRELATAGEIPGLTKSSW